MIKLLSLFLVFVYLSPAQSCYHCVITEFCLNNGAVYDSLSNQVCIPLKKSKTHDEAVKKCKEIHSSADLWVPNDRITRALAILYPEKLRNGKNSFTWIKNDDQMLGKIPGDGNSVTNVPWKVNPARKCIICCIAARRNLFTAPAFLRRFTRIAKSAIKHSPPKTEYCTNSAAAQALIIAHVTAYESNSESKSNPAINLFHYSEYRSALDHKSPTYIIQYLQTQNNVQSVQIVSTIPLPANTQIYAGSKFEEGKPIIEYTKIGDLVDGQSADPRVYIWSLTESNCYNFIILYVPTLQQQLRLTHFIAFVTADGRPETQAEGEYTAYLASL